MVYTITKAIALPENEKANITVEGLLESIEEGMDSKGRPFIRAMLTDKTAHLPVKMWQTGIVEFSKLLGSSNLTPLVVQINGKLDNYNDENQMVASKVAVSQTDINNYINAAPIKGEVLYSGIAQKVTEIKDSNLKALATAALALDKNKLIVCPYSSKNHTEKSGLLHHIYLCLCKILNYAGVPQIATEEVDFDTVFTAIICSRLLGLYRYELDEVTGKIISKDETEKALHGELSNVIILHDIINNLLNTNKSFEYSGKIENVEHCVTALYCSAIKPATIEAVITSEIVFAELTMYSYAESVASLAPGETKQVQVGFNQRKVVRKWAEESNAPEDTFQEKNVEPTHPTVEAAEPAQSAEPKPTAYNEGYSEPIPEIPGPFR